MCIACIANERSDFIHKETGEKPQAFVDYHEMLAGNIVDAVCIATPDHWHARQVLDSLQAGKHVYCEKPMTHTLEEAGSRRRLEEIGTCHASRRPSDEHADLERSPRTTH